MIFGIKRLESGWLEWFIQDEKQKFEIVASRYDEEDFVKKFINSLSDTLRNRKETVLSFFSEPGIATIRMRRDKSYFLMDIALSDREISFSEDPEDVYRCYRFTDNISAVRDIFVTSILNEFKQYDTTEEKFNQYKEEWTEGLPMNEDKFSYPYKELQDLHLTAVDRRLF